MLDHAPEWLRLAEEKAGAASVCDRLRLVVGNVRDMHDVPDESFEYVFALGGVVSYCGDPAAALGEMTRVLRPGGELLADGIHSRFGDMRGAARMGNLDALERLARPGGLPPRVPAVLPEELVTLCCPLSPERRCCNVCLLQRRFHTQRGREDFSG